MQPLFKHIFYLAQGHTLSSDSSVLSLSLAHRRYKNKAFLWGSLIDFRALPSSCSRSQKLPFGCRKKMAYFIIWSLLTPWGSSQLVFKKLWEGHHQVFIVHPILNHLKTWARFWNKMLFRGSKQHLSVVIRVFKMHLIMWVRWKSFHSRLILFCADENPRRILFLRWCLRNPATSAWWPNSGSAGTWISLHSTVQTKPKVPGRLLPLNVHKGASKGS